MAKKQKAKKEPWIGEEKEDIEEKDISEPNPDIDSDDSDSLSELVGEEDSGRPVKQALDELENE